MNELEFTNTTEMALVRTYLAHDRTLMAWIRTAFSMISFGFTILKTSQYLREAKLLDVAATAIPLRNLGATMILLGTASLVTAAMQHWGFLKRMKKAGHEVGFSLSLAVALIITALGALAFLGVFIRTGIF